MTQWEVWDNNTDTGIDFKTIEFYQSRTLKKHKINVQYIRSLWAHFTAMFDWDLDIDK